MGKTGIIKTIAAVSILLLLMTGCGGFVDLSEEESKQIVNYSTNVLSDHNSAVKGSLKNLSKTDLKDIVIKDDPGILLEIQAAKEEATAESEEASNSQSASSDGSDGSDGGDDSGSGPVEVQDADIASIIGLNGFAVEYEGHDVLSSYPDTELGETDTLFSIEPATASDKLLVLYFNVRNTSGADATCDILSLQPKFRFRASGKTQSFLTTLLLDDLSTLEIDLGAGESSRAVLVAELSEEKAEAVSDITLIIMGDDGNTEIALEK